MDTQESPGEARRFGRFLRKVREGRKLSLDAVEELSTVFPERLTKSHLSRIENGQAEPSFRKLFALSQIYDMPLTSLAEQFELDLHRELLKVDVSTKTEEEICEQVVRLVEAGRHHEALVLLTAARERISRTEDPPLAEGGTWGSRFRLGITDCLVHLGRYESAKLEAERLLGDARLSRVQRLRAWQYFVNCCYRLGRYHVAMMGLEQADRELDDPEVPAAVRADFATLRGNIFAVTGRSKEALGAYSRALKIGEKRPRPFETCKTRINIASVMIDAGNYDSALEQLEAALLVAEASGYDRLRALAMSNLAVLHFKRGDLEASESWGIRSNTIARSREYFTLVFRNCYYLMKCAQSKGDEAGVKANRRSLRSLLSRVDENLPEAEAFRADLAGGEA